MMKEGKLARNKDSKEDDKSKLEWIREEIHKGIFGVFYVLLKTNDGSLWKHVAIMLIELL